MRSQEGPFTTSHMVKDSPACVRACVCLHVRACVCVHVCAHDTVYNIIFLFSIHSFY